MGWFRDGDINQEWQDGDSWLAATLELFLEHHPLSDA